MHTNPDSPDASTDIPTSAIRDTRISYVALGLLTELARLGVGAHVSVQSLIDNQRGTIRRDGGVSVAKALRELEGAGYITRARRNPGTGPMTVLASLNLHAGEETAR